MLENPLISSFSQRTSNQGSDSEIQFIQGIPNFVDVSLLGDEELISLSWYQSNSVDYDDYLPLTFKILNCDEFDERRKMYEALDIEPGMRVLEIGCGTGRDSIEIAKLLSDQGELFLQDISIDILTIAIEKFSQREKSDLDIQFFLSSASSLPFPDNFFDRVFHFGGLNTFSNIQESLKEIVRITKPKGKVLLGDEGIPVWLRNTDFFKIMNSTNHHYSHLPPLEDLPKDARNLRLEWFMNNAFYFLVFDKVVGDSFNPDLEIPGLRGGTPRKRYEGLLEGIDPNLRDKVYKRAFDLGKSRVDFLEEVLNRSLG
jgi:ubiquinone/menaquinone biosynthesis C-methylase UbiE